MTAAWNEYMRAYRKRRKELGNPIDRYESNKKYRKNHPEKIKEFNRNYRLSKKLKVETSVNKETYSSS